VNVSRRRQVLALLFLKPLDQLYLSDVPFHIIVSLLHALCFVCHRRYLDFESSFVTLQQSLPCACLSLLLMVVNRKSPRFLYVALPFSILFPLQRDRVKVEPSRYPVPRHAFTFLKTAQPNSLYLTSPATNPRS
jgi:hypothetical protein